jgi:hypothetical protein
VTTFCCDRRRYCSADCQKLLASVLLLIAWLALALFLDGMG